MNNLKPTLTAQDIVQHICADFMFPVTNLSGEECLALSRDAGSVGAIQSMVQVHDFVEQNAKFEQPAVKFESTIYGRRWLGYSRAGENLYPIVRSPTPFCPLPRQQLSEALSLWQEVLPQILGTHALFLGNPFRSMNDQGVTEAELVNALASRLAEGACRKAYQLAREQRKKDAQRLYTARTKLLSHLLAQHSGVFGVGVELMYREDCAETIREKDAAEHIQGLIEALQEDPWFGHSIGHFWTRNFISEAGYRTTLFLLFDTHTMPISKIDGTEILQQWMEYTKGAGRGFNRYGGICQIDEVLRYVECSKLAAQYLRLKPDAKYPSFGMTPLPVSQSLSAIKKDSATNLRDGGGFGWRQAEEPGLHLNNRFS